MQNLLFYISSRARGTILNRSWQGVCGTLRQKDEWTMPLHTDIVHNELTLLYVGKLISRPRQGREILTQADHSSFNFYHENPTIWYTRAYSSLARKYRSNIFLEYLFLNFIIDCLKFFCCRIIRWYVERLCDIIKNILTLNSITCCIDITICSMPTPHVLLVPFLDWKQFKYHITKSVVVRLQNSVE